MATLIGRISIPKTAYSLYDIAKVEKVPAQKMEKLMGETLQRATDASPQKSASGIEQYFNTLGASDSFINAFLSHWALQPFAKGIKLTIERSIKNSSLKEISWASFFVPKATYEGWKKRGKRYDGNKNDPAKFDKMAGLTKVAVTLPNTATVQHFKKVITALEFKLSDAVLMAIDFFMKEKSEIFGEYGSDVKNEYLSENEVSLVFGYVDKKLVNKVWKTIQRWNNLHAPPIKLSDFLESALREKIDRLPLELADPQLLQELEGLKRQEAEVAKMLRK